MWGCVVKDTQWLGHLVTPHEDFCPTAEHCSRSGMWGCPNASREKQTGAKTRT